MTVVVNTVAAGAGFDNGRDHVRATVPVKRKSDGTAYVKVRDLPPSEVLVLSNRPDPAPDPSPTEPGAVRTRRPACRRLRCSALDAHRIGGQGAVKMENRRPWSPLTWPWRAPSYPGALVGLGVLSRGSIYSTSLSGHPCRRT